MDRTGICVIIFRTYVYEWIASTDDKINRKETCTEATNYTVIISNKRTSKKMFDY